MRRIRPTFASDRPELRAVLVLEDTDYGIYTFGQWTLRHGWPNFRSVNAGNVNHFAESGIFHIAMFSNGLLVAVPAEYVDAAMADLGLRVVR